MILQMLLTEIPELNFHNN